MPLAHCPSYRQGFLPLILLFIFLEAKKKSKSDGSTSSEEGMSKKEIALQQALDQITTSFGKGSIMWLGRAVSPRDVPVYSTGSFSLDLALGVGGLPKVIILSLRCSPPSLSL